MQKALLTCAVACVLAACASAPPASAPMAAAAPPAKAACVGAPAASRLPQSGCGPGQTYSQDDVQSTGQSSTPAAALQTLDPLIHH